MKRFAITVMLAGIAAGCAGPAVQQETSATAILEPRSGSQVRGTVTFTQAGPDIVRVSGNFSGHGKGSKVSISMKKPTAAIPKA